MPMPRNSTSEPIQATTINGLQEPHRERTRVKGRVAIPAPLPVELIMLGACVGCDDPDVFFDAETAAAAAAICSGCAVIGTCRDWAGQQSDLRGTWHGVFRGEKPLER